MNRQQKTQLQNIEFCKQYLKPDWNGCKANEYFANKYDTDPTSQFQNKPKDDLFESLRENITAENQVYRNIAHLAFVKKSLVSFLEKVSLDAINVPDKIKDKENYKNVYFEKCKEILEKIDSNSFSFQK